MQNSEILVPLGYCIIAISAIAIVVPILRRTGDALTFWNIFLLGGITFTGIGCLEVYYGNFDWPQLQWFQPSRKEVQIFVAGTILFYASLFASFYLLAKPIDSFGARFLNKWPPPSLALTLSVVALALSLTVGALAFKNVFYLGALFSNLSHKAVVFAVVFSFYHWYQNKRQLPMLGLFVGVFLYCALFAMVIFVGRRLLMSIVAAPLFCMYWLQWRYSSPKKIVLGMALAASIVFVATVFYSTFRHAREIYGMQGDRSFSSVVDRILAVKPSDAIDYVSNNTLHFFSQYCVHYSLLTIHLVNTKEVEVEPLNTILFLATYPVPRALWPAKPAGLGVRIVNDILHLNVPTNWGLGTMGHCWHEGGFLVAVLYGFLVVVVIRCFDQAMRRHPNNCFLIATLCAAAPHALAWARGDTVNMSAEILEAFAFAWVVALAARFIFGTERLPSPGRPFLQPMAR